MATDSIDVIEIFCSYSHEDEALKKELETHLSGMKRQGLITLWSDRQIDPGTGWKDDIDNHLESAEVILLLISADFIASDYCYEKEMMRAMQRDKRGEVRTIPIVLRPVDWKTLPFSYLQALPTDGKPITSWGNRDKAFENVASGIRKVVEQLRSERIKKLAPDDVQWTLSLQGTIDEINRPQVETILSTLRGYVGNSQLQLQRIEAGSIVCVFVGSREGFQIIKSKINSEELLQIAGLNVIGAQEITTVETSKKTQQSPIRQRINQLQELKNALLLYLTENTVNLSTETWEVDNGRPPQRVPISPHVSKLFGIGKLNISEGNVAITMRSGRIGRVLGAGSHQLEQDERPTMTVYLPTLSEVVVIPDVLTRDNEVISNLDLRVIHRVDKGSQSAASGRYKYDPQIILEKIWSPKGSDWRGAVRSIAETVARDVIAQYVMEDIVAISSISNRKFEDEFTEQINQKTKKYLGVEVVATNLGKITIPNEAKKALEENWLRQVQLHTQALEAGVEIEKDQAFAQVRQFLQALAQLPVDEERKTKLLEEMFPDEQFRELIRVYTGIERSPEDSD
jgi:regulator of protease activity HflC (stomatin/prohibitin superfamily)